jgi:hypothetical protein
MWFLNFYDVSPFFNLKEQKYAASRELYKKCPNLCQDTLGNAPKSSWRPFQQNLKGIVNSLGNPKEDSSRDTLGNAQTKVETQ